MPSLAAYGLMYHDVVGRDRAASGLTGAGPDRYKLAWESFRDHLDRIEQAVGVPPRSVDEIVDGGRAPWWFLTFDDGGASGLAVGEELLRRGWCAHFFVTTGFIGRAGFLDALAIRELSRMGHVIGSHSVTHPERMSSLEPDVLLDEWRESVSALSELLGKEVRTASVPGGYYARRVAAAAARAGVVSLFTSEPVRTARGVDGCLAIGRYRILRHTSGGEASRAAAGESGVWLRQYAGWKVRKLAKTLGGEHYVRIRRYLLEGRSEAAPR